MAASLRIRSSIDREDVGLLLGVLISAVGLFGIVGPVGIVVALVAAVATRLAGAPFGVGALHLGALHLGALTSGSGPELLPLVILEGGAALFVLMEYDWFDDVLAIIVLVLGSVALSVSAVSLAESNGVLMAAFALVTAAAILAYGLHRYERVRLGLVPEESV
jgi:hypothetical protein